MNLILITLFLSVICSPVNYAAESEAYLEPRQIITQIGASYVAMLKHNTIAPKECYIRDIGTNLLYNVDLQRQGVPPELLSSQISSLVQPKPDDPDFITSLGNGICGFKMDSVSQNTTKYWNISMVDQNENFYSGKLLVVARQISPRQVTKYVEPGQSLFIDCATSSTENFILDLLYCDLFNPQNEQVEINSERKECVHMVQVTNMSDFGVWKCLQTFKYHMLPNEVTFDVVPIETNVLQTWVNTTDTHLIMGCKVINATTLINYCVMVKPDGNKITLLPGLATKRYTAIGTNITEHICSLQIKLPLEETEKGSWQCEQWDSRQSTVNVFLNVSMDDSTNITGLKIPA